MFTIIPVKPFSEAKTRLSPVLGVDQRIVLSRQLLQRTISTARQVSQVVVVSRDKLVRRLAKQLGAWALVEARPGLNLAIQQAITWVMAQGGSAVLILPADLPLLQPTTLQAIVQVGQSTPAIVMAPCHREEGTNALLLRPPDLIEVMFGPHSFRNHQRAATLAGVSPFIYRDPAIAFDLDIPTDWLAWQQRL